jgi:hypothetical protein
MRATNWYTRGAKEAGIFFSPPRVLHPSRSCGGGGAEGSHACTGWPFQAAPSCPRARGAHGTRVGHERGPHRGPSHKQARPNRRESETAASRRPRGMFSFPGWWGGRLAHRRSASRTPLPGTARPARPSALPTFVLPDTFRKRRSGGAATGRTRASVSPTPATHAHTRHVELQNQGCQLHSFMPPLRQEPHARATAKTTCLLATAMPHVKKPRHQHWQPSSALARVLRTKEAVQREHRHVGRGVALSS